MRDNYSLHRRQRDASLQWLFVGAALGIGFSMVVCVGGYALGALTFPALEKETTTPQVQIQPNGTEAASLATAMQQTLVGAQTLSPAGGASPDTTLGVASTAASTLLPSSPVATSETVPAGEDTPMVGTQPAEQPSPTLTFMSGPQVPAALDAIKTDLVPVVGGTFLMGTTLEEATQAVDECATYGKTCNIADASDSTPTHQVTVDSFQMEVYEVSVAQYVAFLNWKGPDKHKNGCQGQPCAMTTREEDSSYISFDGTTYSVQNPDFYSNHPVTWVTWWGAEEYCRVLNRRLPTEAEWERAARGAENYIYPWGTFENFDPARAQTSISSPKGTVPVDSYPNGASPYGVYNMAGNVEEWVSDWYQSDYYARQLNNPNPQPNPQGPPSGTEKVLRGGSWDTIPFFVRTVHRRSAPPGQPTAAIGFRCVVSGTAAGPAIAPASDNSAPSSAPTLPPSSPAGPTATISPG